MEVYVAKRQQATLCGLRPRAWAEMVTREPFVIRISWPCGYHRDVVVAEDKSWKKIAPAILMKFTTGERGYWTKGGGGITDECPRCRRAALKAKREKSNA